MSVRKLAEGRWQVDTHGIDGRRVRRNRRTQAAAQKLEREIIDAREKGEHWDDRTTLTELWNDFTDVKRPAARASTWKGYETHWRLHIEPILGGELLRRIDQPTAQRFVTELHKRGVEPPTIRRIFSTLSTLLGHGAKQERCRQVTARLVEFPRAEPFAAVVPTLEEILAVTEAIDPRISASVPLAAFATLRWGEAFGLSPLSIMWERGQIHVRQVLEQATGKIVDETKSSRNGRPRHRYVVMPDVLRDALRDHTLTYPDDHLVFHLDGEAIRPRWFYRVWDQAIEQAGTRKFTYHGLRHAAVAVMSAAGLSALQASEAMGHASKAFTLQNYGHLWEDGADERRSALNDLLGASVPRAGLEPASDTGFKAATPHLTPPATKCHGGSKSPAHTANRDEGLIRGPSRRGEALRHSYVTRRAS